MGWMLTWETSGLHERLQIFINVLEFNELLIIEPTAIVQFPSAGSLLRIGRQHHLDAVPALQRDFAPAVIGKVDGTDIHTLQQGCRCHQHHQ
jgi:hypothetical protein